jgi:hypothetical protein
MLKARLEAHLRVCPHCQGELQELNGISHYIRVASQDLRVSQDFDQRVLRVVGSYQVAGRVLRRRSLVRPLVAVAVILLALLGMLQHFLQNRGPAPLPQPAAAGAMVSPAAPMPAAPGDRGDRE